MARCRPRSAGRSAPPPHLTGLAHLRLRRLGPRRPGGRAYPTGGGRAGYHAVTRGRGVNGCTGAFQALGTGSTPVARFVRRVATGPSMTVIIEATTGSGAVW